MKKILRIAGVVGLVSIAGLGEVSSAEVKGWGPVPFGASIEEARKLLKAENPKYSKPEKVEYEFLTHSVEVGRYQAEAVHRFQGDRLDMIFLHLKASGELVRSCQARYETLKSEVAAQNKAEFGKDGVTKNALVYRLENSIARPDGVMIGVMMDQYSVPIGGEPCQLSVSYAPPSKGKSF
jgi:hypothetical protein